METFAPEFAHYWLSSPYANAGDARREAADDNSNAQQAALEELAERVTAARSIF